MSDNLYDQVFVQHLEQVIEKLEQENKSLRGRVKDADSANRTKSDFLAMISHEIRTPMNGVIGLTELLLSAELEGKQKRFAELILSSARNLLTLVNSLLDFSKLEADKMVIDHKVFNLPAMLDELIELHTLAWHQQDKNIKVVADIDVNIRPLYVGDAYRIRQILINFLGNAIKFTEQGEVCLQVKCVGRGVGSDLLRFSVSDTGSGIVHDKQGHVFLPFTQVDDPAKRVNVGTGLGLAICAKLVEMMNGSIGLDSTVGKGSTFWFQLDLPVGEEERGILSGERRQGNFSSEVMEDKEHSGSSPATILIVDDEPVNRLVLRESLQQAGFYVVEATNGMEAVDWCKKRKFDLVFMDCLMPVMDGFAAATAIQGIDETIPVIALTADATATTRERCRECGMVRQLLKPLDFDELGRLIEFFLPACGKTIRGCHLPEQEACGGNDDGKKIIDSQVVDSLCRNIADIVTAADVFLKSMGVRLQQLSVAVGEGDSERVAIISHTIRGSSSQFGSVELSGLCQQLERVAGAGNLTEADSILLEIQQAARLFRDALCEKLEKTC